MVFGEEDWLADFDSQKELLRQIGSLKGVHFLPGYEHYTFYGKEIDDTMQVLVMNILKGKAE